MRTSMRDPDGFRHELRADLGDPRHPEFTARGGAMTTDEIVAVALHALDMIEKATTDLESISDD